MKTESSHYNLKLNSKEIFVLKDVLSELISIIDEDEQGKLAFRMGIPNYHDLKSIQKKIHSEVHQKK